jgi:Na+/melibiose symporter-like transporter
MHGSLIDSHRRSSLSIDQPNTLLSSSERNISDDENTRKPSEKRQKILIPLKIDTKNSPVRLDGVIEYDDDEKEPTAPVTHSADFFRWTHGHRHVMLTFGTICLFAFMTGVEYAVILPTAFDYVQKMTPVNIYVGLILSSYSISGSITGVIMGKISDITGKVKILILVSNIFEIGGNILYFVTENIHIVLLGRFIAGVGMGAVPPVLFFFDHCSINILYFYQ